MSVIGAVHGEEALAAVEREQPSLVLLDISPPEARRWLGQLRGLAHPPLIVAPAVDETRESILGWIEAGVSGYETTNSSSSELIQALHTAARGERSCSQRVMSMVMRRLSTLAASPRAVSAQRDKRRSMRRITRRVSRRNRMHRHALHKSAIQACAARKVVSHRGTCAMMVPDR